jgi:PKD domain-containing protein
MSEMTSYRGARRRRGGGSPNGMIELLEDRMLLAGGIAPAPGAPISAIAGVPITNAIFAIYTVSDPSGAPGTQWRGHIDFGDGQSATQVTPVPDGGAFDIEATHTYASPGAYTVTVMLAVPGSHAPSANTVTTRVTVIAPPPPASIGAFQSAGLDGRAMLARPFQKAVARFADPHSAPAQFRAVIDWGDQSGPTAGRIKRQDRGRYQVVGSHRYQAPGVHRVTVTIRDAAGDEIAAHGSVTVIAR